MLDNAKYGALYGTMKKYISTLADHAIFYGKSEVRDSIADVVKGEAALFLFLARQVNAEEEANGIISRFKQSFLVDSWEVKGENYSSKKFEELSDDVNYLKVCVKNICDVDLENSDDFVLREKVENVSETSSAGNYNSARYEKIPDSLAIFKNALNEDIDLDPSVGKEIGEFILKSHAYERLNKDISDGSIYIYTSKPKINVIIKYILIGLSSVGAFVSIFLLLAICKNIFDGSSSLDGISWFLSAIAGIVYFVFSIFSHCNHLKNDNFKYSFGRRDFFYNNFFLIAILMMMLPPIKGRSMASATGNPVIDVSAMILLAVAIVFGLISILSYCCLQPKKDTKLVDSILERHMSDLSKGTSF